MLLRVDCELRLAGSAATKAQAETWSRQIESARSKELPAKLTAQRNQFISYLDALRLPARIKEVDFHAEGDRLQELLSVSPQPTWLTSDRKERLAEPLGLIALKELEKTDQQLLEFNHFHLDTNKRLDQLLTTANRQQLQSNSLAAAQAIFQASRALENPNQPADWPTISSRAKAAYNDAAANTVLGTQQQRMLVFYVAKLADLRIAAPGTKDFRDAVNGIAALLTKKQDDGKVLYFDASQEAQPSDVGLYRTLLEPVFSQPAVADPNSTFADAASLAILYGAQARLMQRTPEIAKLVEPAAHPELSADVRTLLITQRAFDSARQWDKQAVAAGKTSVDYLVTSQEQLRSAVPKLAGEANRQLPDLKAIVDAFDPSGNSNDAELLRLNGYVRRQQAFQEPKTPRRDELVRESAARYKKSLSVAKSDSTIAAQAAAEFADLQLSLASWTELKPTDYDAFSDQIEPPQGTKAYHLWQAAALARQAIGIMKAPEAIATLAIAHEETAFALGQLDHYSRAIAVCDQGLKTAPAKSAAANQLQATKARSLVRQASELFSDLSQEDRKAKLQQAIVELEAALDDRRSTKRWLPNDAETLASLAEAHIGLAAGSERAARLTQAETSLRAAIVAADPRAPRLSHYRWRLLQVMSNQEGPSLRPAQQAADEIFVAIEKSPADQDPAAIFGIATATAGLFSEPSKLLRFLPAKGPWYEQWRSSDAWKLEAARLYSEASLLSTLPELRRSAQQLALELPTRSQQRRQAEAYLQDNLARQLCYEFERMKAPSSSAATENSQRSFEADRQSKAGIATSAIHDAVQKHWDSQEPRIQGLLSEINRATLSDLQGGKVLPNATVLEKRALWKYVNSAPSLESRDKYLEICKQHGALITAGNDPSRQDLAQTSNDLLKPVFYFAALAPQDGRLEAFIKRYKPAETEKKK